MKKIVIIILMITNACFLQSGVKDKIKTHTRNTSLALLKTISYLSKSSDVILSTKTLKAVALVGAPYFYYHPEKLIKISEKSGEAFLKINSLIAEGIIKGMAKNPKELGKIATILTAKEVGSGIFKKFTDTISSLAITAIKQQINIGA